jgi:tripartite-type tricarboxylate transporter receptor subunit TctC
MSMTGDHTKLPRRAALLAAAAAGLSAPARAQGRPLRMVVGFPAGSAPDILARLLVDGIREAGALPAGLVVDNRPGAGGTVAAAEVARGTAAADAGTVLFGDVGALAMAPSTFARLPYDPARDFVPVAEVAAVDFAFMSPPTVPATDIAGWTAWARGRQGGVFLGSPGAGTPSHFGASLLAAAGGVRMEAVHFRAQGDATAAILAGDVQGLFGAVSSVAPLVRAAHPGGAPRALLVTGPERSPLLPEVPTAAEAGLPTLAFHAWFGLVAPAATPAAALEPLEAAVLRALALPAARARIEAAGFRVTAAGRDVFGARMAAERTRWAEVVRATGFRAIE